MPGSFATLKAIAEGAVVFSALTFVAGWSYLATYYRTFGLNPLELDLSVPVVCTIAVYVLWEAKWPLVIGGLVLLGLAELSRRNKLSRSFVVVAVIAALFTAGAAGGSTGRANAHRDAFDNSALPWVGFTVKGDHPEYDCVRAAHELQDASCKLLLRTKGSFYFFKPFSGDSAANVDLYAIADAEVTGVHIQQGGSFKRGADQ